MIILGFKELLEILASVHLVKRFLLWNELKTTKLKHSPRVGLGLFWIRINWDFEFNGVLGLDWINLSCLYLPKLYAAASKALNEK